MFRFRESPKYLLYRGRDDKAADVLQKIAKFNGQTCDINRETFEALAADDYSINSGKAMLGGGAKQLQATWTEKIRLEMVRYKMLFSSFAMARLTILIWLIYICDYWGFTVAGFYLPTIVSAKNASLNLSLKYTFRSYIWIYLPGIAGVILGVLGYDLPHVGRRLTMLIASALMAVSLFLFATVTTEASNVGLNVMEYFFQSMFNAVLYGWTPESFPAPVRGTACGLSSFWGRLFGIISPIAAAQLAPPADTTDPSSWNRVLYLAVSLQHVE